MNYRISCSSMLMAVFLVGLNLIAGCGTQIGIAASPSTLYVEVGGTTTVGAVTVMSNGSSTAVSTALAVTSSDLNIATVAGAVVTGVAEGTVTLTITDGTYETTATVHVVAEGTLPDNIEVTPASVQCTPESDDTALRVIGVFDPDRNEELTEVASYSSSDTSVALVTADLEIVCLTAGTAEIEASYLGLTDSVVVTVSPVPPTGLAVLPETLECMAGEQYYVQVQATWADGSTTDVSTLASYSSAAPAVAVAGGGVVACQAVGTTTIEVSYNGVSASQAVEVSGDATELVDLAIQPSSISCVMPGYAEFAVVATYGDGHTEDVTDDPALTLSTSDPTITQPIGDQFSCSQAGSATIQAEFGDLTATASVVVN